MTSNGHGSDDASPLREDPYGPGWWVGSDGRWRTPDEDFDADVHDRNHPMRRVAIVLLAVIVVGATTVGAWLGGRSQTGVPTSAGPSSAQLASQVKGAVNGTGANEFGVAGVSRVVCDRPNSWEPGNKFKCYVYGTSHEELGQYDGTVEPTTSAGYWQWSGSWNPSHRYSSTDS